MAVLPDWTNTTTTTTATTSTSSPLIYVDTSNTAYSLEFNLDPYRLVKIKKIVHMGPHIMIEVFEEQSVKKMPFDAVNKSYLITDGRTQTIVGKYRRAINGNCDGCPACKLYHGGKGDITMLKCFDHGGSIAEIRLYFKQFLVDDK